MNLKNRYNLWKLKIGLAPCKAFKDDLWRDLNNAWGARYNCSARYQPAGLLYKFAAFAAVVLLLIGGTGAYAYVSPEVTVGTALYPIKQAVESAEEATKITPEAKAKFYLKQIKRREAEKTRLSSRNTIRLKEKTEQSIERAEKRLEKAREIIEKKRTKQLKKLKEKKVDKQVNNLKN